MKAFQNVPVLVGGKIVRTSLVFGESIVSVGTDLRDAEPVALPEDAVVLPGFIDEHVHGAGGCDAMDGSEKALATIADTLAAEGVTAFLATTMTQSPEAISSALRAVKRYRALGRGEGAELLGAHLEGPFIAAEKKGAQPEEYVVKPSVRAFERYYAESGENIRIVTLAPEEEGAAELIGWLVSRGIVVSIGHTGAKYSDIERAAEAGASHVTHTYNAQSSLHHREIGAVGGALLLDGLVCELICDGIHVSVPAMQLLYKCKGAEKLILITDAMRAKGLADGVSELGGQKVFVKNGEARLADGALAGSVLRMNVALKNLVEKVGVPLEKAAACASYNPACALGVEGERGSIEAGKRADFAVLDGKFNVIATYRGGVAVYRR